MLVQGHMQEALAKHGEALEHAPNWKELKDVLLGLPIAEELHLSILNCVWRNTVPSGR